MRRGRQSLMRLLAVLLAVAAGSAASAQTTGKLFGTVRDAQGNPIIGTNVLIKGTRMGAATDLDGQFFVLNISVGSYDIQVSSLGYSMVTLEGVGIEGGLTTNLDVTLQSSAIQMEEVTIIYERPQIQRDQTFKVQTLKAADMRELPVNDLSDVLSLQAGVTRNISTTPVNSQPVFGQFATIPTDGFHFRGGREGEVEYLYDGVPVRDDLWGGFEVDAINGEGLEDMSVYSGTFGAQYGEAMSGVMVFNPISQVKEHLEWYASGYTDRIGGKTGFNGGSENTWQGEMHLAGPVPYAKNIGFSLNSRYYTTDGYIFGFIYPDWVDSEGRDKTGTAKEVPMQFRDIFFNTGKIMYQATENLRIDVGGFAGVSQAGNYNHYFKYNPFGTPTVDLNQTLAYMKWNHALSDRTYYSVVVSRYDRTFHSSVWNTAADYAVIPQNGSGEFSVSGEDWVYFDSRYLRFGAEGQVTSQVNNQNLVSLGGSFDQAHAVLRRLNPDGFSPIENYNYMPIKASYYVTDKMEFNTIGMILNLGLRLDVVDPMRTFPTDIHDTEDSPQKGVKASSYFSPRIGVSYPISDKAAFHFGYGHYYQYPNFYKVYQGANRSYPKYPAPNIQSVSGAIAVGDIKEEHTVNYEGGVQTRLGEKVTLDVTGFYRETSNLIGTIIIEDVKGNRFPALDNINYSTVKGVEFTLRRFFSNTFSAFLNYTYSQTLVSSSLLFDQQTDVSRTYLADWDQPQVFSGSLSFKFPREWGFTLTGGASSGFPYTFNTFAPNEERGPMIISMDTYVYKDFKWAGMKQRIFLQVNNLLNRRNVWWVYSDSGKPGVDASDATSDDYTNDPTMWGPGRRIQIGLSLWGD
ncbi:MAG: TonB-dependent receptor [bacterium]